MTTLQRTLDYLDRALVRYAHSKHPVAYTAREVATVGHLPLHKVAKTVVFVGEGGHGMAVVPADALVDLAALRGVLGVPTLRLATEQELAALFPETELGSMPPIGNLFDMPVFFDRSLVDEKFIGFNAGTHRDLIYMGVDDYVRLVQPVIGEFAIHAASSSGL
jgi:Ala-tRNA(Pro) deacylase